MKRWILQLIEWRKNNEGKLYTAAWVVRVLALALIIKMVFVPAQPVRTEWVRIDPHNDSLAVVNHYIVNLTVKDSTQQFEWHETNMGIDSINDDSVARYIAKFIRGEWAK